MSRVQPADVPGNAFQRFMGHCPSIVEKWFALDESMRFSGRLDPALKEEVRRSLADGLGCKFCASLGAPEPETHDTRTALAVAFADLVLRNFQQLHTIDDEAFAVLRGAFDDEEIVELTIWTLFMIAGQGFGALMHVPPSTEAELTDYISWRAEGEAAARTAAE